jgi:hypothetical protein
MSLVRQADHPDPRITMSNVTTATQKIRSSLTPEELNHFREMQSRYSRG